MASFPRSVRPRGSALLGLGSLVAAALAAAAGPVRAEDPPPAPPAEPTPAATPAPTPSPTPQRQVRAEIRVLEWQLDNSFDFDFAVLYTPASGTDGGILNAADLTLPAASPLSSAARFFLQNMNSGQGSFEAVVETLETVGKVNVLQAQEITMPVGPTEAGGTLASGQKLPVDVLRQQGLAPVRATDFRDTGVQLTCKALDVKYDEFVELEIDASVTDATGFINISKDATGNLSRVPILDRRKIQNRVLVRDRSIFISGLLKSSRETERRQGVPWLAELPILKWFLSNDAKDEETLELVFLVRPEILATN